MSKTIEVHDIAQWEVNDSELAKYTIQKQNYEMKEAEELINYLGREKLKLQDRIDKAIQYIWSTKYEWGDLEQDNEDFDIDVYELLNILGGK